MSCGRRFNSLWKNCGEKMNKWEEVLQRFCPDGVEYKAIADFTNVLRGKRLTRKQLSGNGKYPVFHGGLEPLGFCDSNNREGDTVMIINVGSSAGTVGYCKDKFWSSDGCFCLEKSDCVNSRYLYYTISCRESWLKSKVRIAGIPTLDAAVVEKLVVPVPPMEVQLKIIKILDVFEYLFDEIEMEIALREQQYEYCKKSLMYFEEELPVVKLSDCCVLERGMTPIQKAVPGKYPLVVTASVRKSSSDYQFSRPAVCIPLVSSRGHGVAWLNRVYYQEGEFALGTILCAVTPTDERVLSAEYLYYYINFMKDILIVPLMKGGANVSLTVNSLKNVRIPLPPYEDQVDIVSRLKSFELLIGKLNEEIEYRKKQYHYYRDRLFGFMEMK